MGVKRGFNASIALGATITKEYKGEGSDTIPVSLTLDQYPITKDNNSTVEADNSSFVSIYINESTGTVHNDSYSINTSLGTVSMNVSTADDDIELTYNYYRYLGYCKGVNFDSGTGLEKIYVVGTRDAKEIVQGNTDLTGTIDEFFIDRRAYKIGDESNINDNIADQTLEIMPDSSGAKKFYLRSTKFNTFSLDFTSEGITGNSVEFSTTNISSA